METYSLSEFGLNKQSLKRKLNEIKHACWKAGLEKTLDERTTKYSLEIIEYLVEVFYSGKAHSDEVSEQPLSVYYAKQNKEKYKELKSLINMKKTGSSSISLEREVRKVLNDSHDNFIKFEKFNTQLSKIAEKYNVSTLEVNNIATKIEEDWFNESLTE